jgi:gliding motility-associated-like protein
VSNFSSEMGYRISRYFIGLLIAACFFNQSTAQSGLCPSNLNFEMGDFSGWEGRTGTAGVYPLSNIGIVPGRHTIIDAATAGNDPFGFFPQMYPGGGNFGLQLGNSGTGAQAESISYTYTIPSTLTKFSMQFFYAVVLENPAGHSPPEQPRFRARIIDVTTGVPIPCVDFDFISGSSTGGFRISSVNPGVLYKDWTPISINLDAYIGRTIMLEFVTEDCTRTGHFGYAYVDVGTVCNGAITGNFICPGEPGITLNAPFGYQAYRWFDGPGFANVIGTGQSLTLNPAPAVGATFPVEITPFAGFGCLDTLYAIVDVATAPVADAGPDKTMCNGQLVQIGSPPLVAHTYSWVPASLLDNALIANPWAGPVSTPTVFTVTVTDEITGCTNTDDVLVSQASVDTTVTLTGDRDFCIGEPGGTFSVNSSSSAVQWYEATSGLIAGATALTYAPIATGVYWAEMSQGGCLDSSGFHDYYVRPLPTAAFTPDNDSGCVNNSTLTFTNNSTTPDNANMFYVWKFSDGVIDNNTDAIRMFPRMGTYNVKLVTTTEFGCKDSIDDDIFIMPGGKPDFTWDSVCTGRPVQFTNLSNESGSPQAWYRWDFGNGDPLFLSKDPPPVTYIGPPPAKVDVILKMTTLGCETDTQTVVKTIQVNRQVDGIRYKTITVPQGSSQWIHIRDSIGTAYNWRPAQYLSSYNTRYTQFTAGDDTEYLIDMTDIHTCITTDTMMIQVLKKPGYYLPTAFTPNGDGLNDIIRPYLIGMKGLKSFSIYNRGGQLIFFSKNYGEGWDGKFQGETQNTGVFVWVLEFYDANNKLVMEKGTLTLIR